MSFEVDEDILQDFLVEAGEILELLQEQLVELENNPEDSDLLNAIFRGYHTVKGGAGFLALTELVDICHGAENVFDMMRNGQRTLTPELMDTILQATDVVVEMFENVKLREPLEAAPSHLIDVLHKLSKPQQDDENIFDSVETSPNASHLIEQTTPAQRTSELVIENVSALDPQSKVDANSDDIDTISEDEFEALLDELHGTGGPSQSLAQPPQSSPTQSVSVTDDDEISDDEFEELLNNLHGKGKAPTEISQDATKSNAESSGTSSTLTSANAKLADKLKQDSLSFDKSNAGAAVKTDLNKADSQSNQNTQTVFKASVPAQKTAVNKKAESKSSAPQGETTVRVDTKSLDKIMNLVGELVLVRNRLLSLGISVADESMTKAIANLDVVTGDLQGAVMKTRMQPIKKVFGRFPRVVRDMARTLKKEISLVLEGEETDLDKNLVEALADPLVHLVRNSVDHGIEMPDEREACGKPRMGTVKLAAAQEGDHILLTIADDGKGMDAEKLKEIAISRGVLDVDSAARMSDVEAFSLIFAPGFSTKTEISDISGRGVGMDVVKTKINQLNGTVNINSALGEGTTLEIKVPLTLAILPTLMIVVSEQTFAIPLGSVNEIINMDVKKTNTVDNQLTMIVRSKAIPLFYLKDWLHPHKTSSDRTQGHVVVVQIGTKQVGFVVDSLIGQEEVVIKPLDALLQGTAGMAGATITSDGGIALILDIPSLLKRHM